MKTQASSLNLWNALQQMAVCRIGMCEAVYVCTLLSYAILQLPLITSQWSARAYVLYV